ncbi:Solute carrier family 2, facilitated glucose transporter member [Sesbania bispinosa]|nr:Solute carrier family 2, facilitated glucose transporter member [Sesbania bispinosa]
MGEQNLGFTIWGERRAKWSEAAMELQRRRRPHAGEDDDCGSVAHGLRENGRCGWYW